MIIRSLLFPKSATVISDICTRHTFIFLIVGSGALLVVVDRPWNIRVLLGPFRVNC